MNKLSLSQHINLEGYLHKFFLAQLRRDKDLNKRARARHDELYMVSRDWKIDAFIGANESCGEMTGIYSKPEISMGYYINLKKPRYAYNKKEKHNGKRN